MKPRPRQKDVPVMEQYQLGYWRKHPDLHGFIVQTFAGGKDDCQQIELTRAELEQIINAVEADALPHTEGFFFGESYKPGDNEDEFTDIGTMQKVTVTNCYAKQKAEDLKILREAIEWLEIKEPDVWRSIHYLASW
jgi:hypothetical protein